MQMKAGRLKSPRLFGGYMQIPKEVNEIIEKLQVNGYEAYCVGGCVRDSMLGREPEDWDITTSAMPEEVKALFRKTVDTGIEHGTVTVLIKGRGYEVTTYRIDGKYEDSRRPTHVEFTRTLEKDLLRRDFTINAMAYNDKDGLVDIFDGVRDLEKKRIRCVGNAKERFGEDALRILRAIRFSAQLSFEIEQETRNAIQELAVSLEKISAERIQVELVKLLLSDNPDYIAIAYELGVSKIVLASWDAWMESGLGERLLTLLKVVPKDKVLRITTLLYEATSTEAKYILKRLKFDNDTINGVCKLLEYKEYRIDSDGYSVRKAMFRMGELIQKHLVLQRAIGILNKDSCEIERIDQIEKNVQLVKQKGECTNISELQISGKDLIEYGMKPGREMGVLLQRLLLIVLESPEKNNKKTLLEIVETMES